jgi:hypothetical protein
MALITRDFLNANEDRAYPIHEAATRCGINGNVIPNDLIVDANIWIPKSIGTNVYISSIGNSAKILSVTLLAVDYNPICGEPSSSSSAQPTCNPTPVIKPVGVVSLVKPITPYKNYPIQPMKDGVAGWISFGSGVTKADTYFVAIDDPANGLLVNRAVRAYLVPPVTSLGKANSDRELKGIVGLTGAVGRVVVAKSTRMINGVTRDVITIGLDTTRGYVQTMQDFAGDCGKRPSAKTCDKTPILSIEDVAPDVNGNIDLLFEGDVIVGGVQDGLVLDFPYGTADVCPPKDWVIYQMIPGDCFPEITSSSAPEPPPESSSGQPIPSSSAPSSIVPPGPPSYVLDFEHNTLFPLEVRAGEIEIQDLGTDTNRAVATSLAGGNEAVDLFYDPPDVADTYTLGSLIKPRDSVSREGHVSFGFYNTSDFWFFAVQLSHVVYPNGLFYIGRRLPRVGYGGGYAGPGPIGSQYFFQLDSIYAFSPSSPLVVTDYTVSLFVHKSGSNTLIDWSVSWLSNVVAQTYVVARNSSQWDPTKYDRARIGLGSVTTVCEFDYFRINA